ncbi:MULTISPECIES: glycosyltransferase [Cellulosimicrobium]|uniref:Glycosyltransferase n=1 Tax=Cellulosimicrobium sp. ES-005 TaxID=3163031 RepID=A0AAU8G215_9MICO|nr:glycosyltransferase [Cellulosimicrobium cellulans]MCO7274306.1 glycosyltransferase [Cellulosimicrobium cellulans]
MTNEDLDGVLHKISVVVPVYQGERTLPALLEEIERLCVPFATPAGAQAQVTEVLLVFDHGPDGSAAVIRDLAAKYDVVRPVWLSRNFGQHAATLAGMASSGGDWIVTLDEDGQHDPADMGVLLDAALAQRATVVYAAPTNAPPHSAFRNVTSKAAKRVIEALAGGTDTSLYQSYRLVLGEIGRSVAAYAGPSVYLDVALGWVAGTVTTAPVALRDEGERRSGYSLRRLLSHFWRMVLSSGTRGLRIVSVLGAVFGVAGVVVAVALAIARIAGESVPAGWTSLIVVMLLATGLILFAIGVVAEYIGVAVNMAMGRPLYLIVSDPAQGPLGRARDR